LEGANTDLFEIALAGGAAGIFANPGEGGEQDSCQDTYNGDHY
jgi:hypothetical protein